MPPTRCICIYIYVVLLGIGSSTAHDQDLITCNMYQYVGCVDPTKMQLKKSGNGRIGFMVSRSSE